jgi:hypothetical protein
MAVDLNYYDTLIAVADDCPVTHSVVPPVRAEKKTVAVLQYEMIAAAPFGLTQEDVLYGSARTELLRAEFFATPRACLRSSPLPKKYGWGLLFDAAGRVALCPVESAAYAQALNTVTVLKAFRSRRAR